MNRERLQGMGGDGGAKAEVEGGLHLEIFKGEGDGLC